ncbi:xanthine dehydrogenase family protein molybdopterin-binding subunit [Geminicoccus roseus]|uniref:xanthine dehydrogenase family protein molybdopterin-binding subunit n=1 Tax=Geminicoccus roseus TaxID=404900 RepID=UPI0006880B1C|nr:molybdopterin cofactor-binding domain-containing protein [Geminicoccus roseus]
MSVRLSRRPVLAGLGGLVLGFRLGPALAQTETGKGGGLPVRGLPGSLDDTPRLDAWIRVDRNGAATVLTGKAELGQGLKTALLQVAAEELKLAPGSLSLVTADTGRTPDEGYTAASHSMRDSGTAIRHAAAQVREILIGRAAARWGLPAAGLVARNGMVHAPDGRRLGYGELVDDQLLSADAQPTSRLTDPAEFTVMDRPLPRIDLPGKVTGAAAYVQDMRPAGMLHARVVRPPSYGAELVAVPAARVEQMAGVVRVVRDGRFLAVVAEEEWTAIQAMRTLAALAEWRENASLPDQDALAATLMALPAEDTVIHDSGSPGAGGQEVSGTFTRPFLAHGSIGPSCAVALADEDGLTVWTHSQGVFPLRGAIAAMLDLPEDRVRCIHAEGAGCYGQNGADDVAADAALIARAIPGRPIRVQWMREQEHGWEPFGPGMVVALRAAVGADGAVAAWHHEVWSQSHMMRPGPPGTLLAARHKADPAPPAPPVQLAQPQGGGDRNAIPLYAFAQARVVHHFLPDMPLRGSSMRSLGGYLNVMAIESSMDDLALLSGQDPVQFRLRHLQDARAREVVLAAARRFAWDSRPAGPGGTGCGFAFARYKNLEAYCAVAMEVAVDRESGQVAIRRVAAAVDTGQIVNPDGVRNQIEGGIVQAASWTLFERVSFDRTRITSVDWSAYPILRFSDLPDTVEVELLDRPGLPFLGVAEAAQGPAGAALANAIRDATGQRLHDLPLDPQRIRTAILTGQNDRLSNKR